MCQPVDDEIAGADEIVVTCEINYVYFEIILKLVQYSVSHVTTFETEI